MSSQQQFTRLAALAAMVAALPFAAQAESNFVTGAGALTATSRLDFRVVIPRILYLRVGAGTNVADNATVNLIDFTVTAANVGDGSAVAASAGSGDLGSGAVTARVQGNAGSVTLSSSTVGALGNGAGDTISFAQILTDSAALGPGAPLPHPALADGATTSTTVPAVGRVVNRDARWTYSYANTATVPAGTYGGVNANNGRVTYTASMP